jgi:hypothetical protein
MEIRLGATCSISQKLKLSAVFTLNTNNQVVECSYVEAKTVRDGD